MNILYFGTSVFAVPPLRALLEADYPVVAVVTQPDRPAGRGGKLTPSPVKQFALTAGLPLLQPESCRTPDFLETVRAYQPDLNVVAAYGQFLPDALRTLPRHGTVNLHGSLLPKYRGAAPIQRAIWQGEEETGVTLMWMAREMDAGDMIAAVTVPITATDTAGTLTATLAERAAELLLTWLPAISSGAAPHLPQDPHAVTFAPVIRKEERVIDWTQPAVVIARQIHALAPTPAATTTFRGMPVKILDAQPVPHASLQREGQPGEIVEIEARTGLYVATGAGMLQVLTLQLAGKRPLSGADFLRGYHVTIREPFIS